MTFFGPRAVASLILVTVSLSYLGCNHSSGNATTPNSPPPSAQTTNVAPAAALQGMGQWIHIGDESYFVPESESSEWAPYQNGQWIYDEELGWSWSSGDSWGFMTDHYGIWRHHPDHGWVWLPFSDHHYEPHCVTWFNDGDYVGWYPYHAGYHDYERTQNFGFDDGFWLGYQVGNHMNERFHFGISLVTRENVTYEDVHHVIVSDHDVVLSIATRGLAPERIQAGKVGAFPGGDRGAAHEFLQNRAAFQAPAGRSSSVTLPNGRHITQPPGVGHVQLGGHGAAQAPSRQTTPARTPEPPPVHRPAPPAERPAPPAERPSPPAPTRPAPPTERPTPPPPTRPAPPTERPTPPPTAKPTPAPPAAKPTPPTPARYAPPADGPTSPAAKPTPAPTRGG